MKSIHKTSASVKPMIHSNRNEVQEEVFNEKEVVIGEQKQILREIGFVHQKNLEDFQVKKSISVELKDDKGKG